MPADTSAGGLKAPPARDSERPAPFTRRDPFDQLLEELALRMVEDTRRDRSSPHPLDELLSKLIARDREALRAREETNEGVRPDVPPEQGETRVYAQRGVRPLYPQRGQPPRPITVRVERRPAGRRRLFGFALAFVLCALAAMALAVALLPDSEEPASGRPASELAELADVPSLRPIVLKDGRGGLATRGQVAPPAVSGPRPGVPRTIAIPAAGIVAKVEPVHQVEDGIEVPEVGRAGWFAGGARPGEPGRAVVVGHLDTRRGPGLFARLPQMPDGSRVTIKDTRGDAHRYKVIGRTVIEKESFPADAVYGRARRPVLVLVTCGGPWDEDTGYRDNVIVYARSA